MWLNVTIGIAAGTCSRFAFEPFHLHAVDVAVIRRVVGGDGIEPDEMDAAIGALVVVGTEDTGDTCRGCRADSRNRHATVSG